ncbi:hypothetical protein quinque_000345 [Culex quinquefasciatus]
MLELITNGIMTSSGMDISESFRPEDLGKTDFFDFVGSAGTRDAANGGQSEETATSAAADRPPGVGGGGGGGGGSSGTSSSSSASSSRNGPDGGVNGSGSVADSGNGSSGSSTSNNQPLQGFDQFWGPDKDANRLDQTMFDDINRYCWIQQQGSGPGQQPQQQAGGAVSNTVADTDGQIYTLTVLNGAPEPWVLRKDPSAAEPPPPASNLDLDTILGGFPGYVKTECFSYDDSGFGTDHHGKEDQQQQLLNQQQQQQHQHQQHLHQQVQQIPVTSTNIVLSNSLMDPNSVIAYQNNNNNDWQMSDHNVIEHETTSESLLRCALQGKGYTKGTAVQLQNGGITVIPAGQIKEEDLRRLVYTGEADTMAYADSTLSANPLFEDSTLHSPGSNHNPAVNNPQHVQHPVVGDLGSGVVVDDMFLTLDSTFTEDYEKLKRIASEVQQFCTDNNNYTEIIVETAAAINQHQNPALISSNNSLVISSAAANATGHHAISTTTSSDVVTTTSTTKVKAPRSSKKYKRSLNNNNSANSTTTTNNNNNSIAVNNNNNTSMSNLNTTAVSILSSTTSSSQNPSSNPSPTGHCNGQRKERSLHYCSICSKGFKDKYSVNVHIRTHTGEKPFACSLCGKSFRQKAHLAKHYQTHMAQKNPAGNVKAGKQSRAAAEQAAAAAAAAALQQSPVSVAAPPPPLPSLTAAGTLQSQAVVSSGATAAPILLNTATIVASR